VRRETGDVFEVGGVKRARASSRLVALSRENVETAIEVAKRVFPDEEPGPWFRMAVDPSEENIRAAHASGQSVYAASYGPQAGAQAFDAARPPISPRYWVATSGDKVVGTIGLYSYAQDQREALWVGWFAVAPEARGKGTGSQLLDFNIATARQEGMTYMRLYTSTSENEAAAQRLYQSRGLHIIRTDPPNKHGHQTLYRELRLR
jgi:GNAT superfamily N-acetyltransferase